MEELLGRQAPHSAPAEQAVIGSMLIDNACIPEVIKLVRADEFYIQTNREIFETIFAMFSFGKEVDPVTVMDQMKVRGVFHESTTQQYLMEVMNLTPTAANVLKYAAIVRDQALLRNLQKAADEIQALVSEGTGELYICEDFTALVQVFASGDLDATVRAVTGYGKDRLELLGWKTAQGQRWECAWASAGENGDLIARTLILDDGNYHYTLTLQADAEKGGELALDWSEIFQTFELGREEITKG